MIGLGRVCHDPNSHRERVWAEGFRKNETSGHPLRAPLIKGRNVENGKVRPQGAHGVSELPSIKAWQPHVCHENGRLAASLEGSQSRFTASNPHKRYSLPLSGPQSAFPGPGD